MDAAKHTPGPWCLYTEEYEVDFLGVDGQIESPYGACTASGTGIASAWCGQSACREISVTEAEANARLIAAAPDMLEALKGILTANVDGKNVERYLDAIDAARAAIAKAEGRTDG